MSTVEHSIAVLATLLVDIASQALATHAATPMAALERVATRPCAHPLPQPPLGLVFAPELELDLVFAGGGRFHACLASSACLATLLCALMGTRGEHL